MPDLDTLIAENLELTEKLFNANRAAIAGFMQFAFLKHQMTRVPSANFIADIMYPEMLLLEKEVSDWAPAILEEVDALSKKLIEINGSETTCNVHEIYLYLATLVAEGDKH